MLALQFKPATWWNIDNFVMNMYDAVIHQRPPSRFLQLHQRWRLTALGSSRHTWASFFRFSEQQQLITNPLWKRGGVLGNMNAADYFLEEMNFEKSSCGESSPEQGGSLFVLLSKKPSKDELWLHRQAADFTRSCKNNLELNNFLSSKFLVAASYFQTFQECIVFSNIYIFLHNKGKIGDCGWQQLAQQQLIGF